MYMSREIMHCKPGKAKELVSRFRQLSAALDRAGLPPLRIYTDISGEDYWTVVTEMDIESLDQMADQTRKTMTDPDVARVMEGYHELVASGKREIYRVESL